MALPISSHEDALIGAKIIEDYFDDFNTIEDYMRTEKLNSVAELPVTFPGMELKHDLFSDFNISPADMDFQIIEHPDNYTFDSLLEITTTHVGKQSVPGKTMKWIIKETNTNKVVGFIRFGSPMMMCAPRNKMLGSHPEDMSLFNKSAIMGFQIVPVQPFGYNYLGGKLMALICASHFSRRAVNKKYGTNIVLFETTSLYGKTKGASMYDGLKPFIRYKGNTESNFLPTIKNPTFKKLIAHMEAATNTPNLDVKDDASSRRLRLQNKCISIIKNSLDDSTHFDNIVERAKNLTEQKRYYVSDYGIENMTQIIRGEDTEIIKKSNYDNYELEYIIEWWRRKAIKRFDKLKKEGRLRMEQEVWNDENAVNIDIIR